MWVRIPPPAGAWNELFHGVLNMIIKICIKRDDIMILKLTSKKKLLLTLCCIVFTLGLSITIQLKETPTILSIDPHSSIPFAHAADGEGCSKCHSTPITGSCTSCHSSPPTTLDNGILFPHHGSDSTIKTCETKACHNAGTDARYVDSPNASHSYCNKCHSNDMSHG